VSSTQADLDEILIRIRICETVTAAYKAGVEELRAEHCDTAPIDRQLVVKELELGLLKTRRDEIADELFSYGRHSGAPDHQMSRRRDVSRG